MVKRRSRGAAIAWGVALILGLVMPVGDVAAVSTPAFAQDVVSDPSSEAGADDGSAESGSSSTEGGPDSAPDLGDTDLADSDAAGSDVADSLTVERLSENDAEAGTLSELSLEDGGIAPMSMPVAGRPYLAFTVRNVAGDLVGGATVQVQGPKANNNSDNTNGNWGGNAAIYTVTDCVTDPCAANSFDQDSTPGAFAVDRLNASGSQGLSQTSRYRIRQATAPAGSTWTASQNWVAIPAQSNNSATPQNGAWQNTGTNWVYTFPEPVAQLQVQPYAPICHAGYVYSIGSSGQLQQVSPTGVVSNIGSTAGANLPMNALGVGTGGTEVFAVYRNPSPASQGRVYKFNTLTGTWSRITSGNGWEVNIGNGALVAGAVSPLTGTYYVGGFRQDNGNFILKATNAAGTNVIDNGMLNLTGFTPGYDNGDITFDGEGNLYLVRGANSGDMTRTTIFRVAAADLAAAEGTTGNIPFTQFVPQTSLVSGINGATYDATGRLFLGTDSGLYHVMLPGTPVNLTQMSLSGSSLSSTDLAACSPPPMIKVQKELPDGRVVAGDQFPLEVRVGGTVSGSGNTATITGGTVLQSATASSPESGGVQDQKLGAFPIPSGRVITFSETLTPAQRANYASGYECTIDGQPLVPAVQGAATAGSVTIPPMSFGKTVVCTFKNTIISASKSADPVNGTLVDADGIVTYTLTFNNSQGFGAATVQHRDHLADVLDDAFFVNAAGNEVAAPVITATGGVAGTWNAANQRIDIGGTVAAGATGTLSYRVKVRPNSSNDAAREQSAGGYLLRNYLTRNSVATPPTSCAPSVPVNCTEHPVNAWKVDKGSLPTNARLHTGGNSHYRVTATKLNGATNLKQLVLSDDLTHVFKTAGWSPNAAVPNGALPHGVYIYNASNQTINLAGAVTPVQPTAVQDVTTPVFTGGRWILTSGAPIDVPAQAVRVEMWFAVQAGERPPVAGYPQGIPYGVTDPWAGANAPQTGWKFVNYATGAARTGVANTVFNPNTCITGTNIPDTSLAPNAAQPADTSFPAQCQTEHELSANYFTIRKDVGGQGVADLADDPSWDPDPTGLWNMVDHEFEIRDDVSGAPTSYPSVKLCRTDYDPNAGWNGTWISPALAGDENRWDWGEGSATLAKIQTWNNLNPTDQRPLCGLLYPISSGSQEGRWRSENLDSESATLPGRYWLVETRAPDRQVRPDATQGSRTVPGVQLLTQPVAFVIWPEEGTPIDSQSWHGRGQLDVPDGASSYLDRCNPSANITARPTACVNPTGYLMLVRDAAPLPLPLAGGQWLGALTIGGVALLLAVAGGIWWWRRRQHPEMPDPSRGGGEVH